MGCWAVATVMAFSGAAAPGAEARPILSAAEATPFTEANYLRWSGTYTAPTPDPWRPEDVRLEYKLDATATPAEWAARVNPSGQCVEGDTDFVFGRASAVFNHTRFHLVSTRKPSDGVIFAPNTAPAFPHGFLVRHCLLTTDSAYHATPTGHFGRSWGQGASTTGYLPGVTPNGRQHRPPVQRPHRPWSRPQRPQPQPAVGAREHRARRGVSIRPQGTRTTSQ